MQDVRVTGFSAEIRTEYLLNVKQEQVYDVLCVACSQLKRRHDYEYWANPNLEQDRAG